MPENKLTTPTVEEKIKKGAFFNYREVYTPGEVVLPLWQQRPVLKEPTNQRERAMFNRREAEKNMEEIDEEAIGFTKGGIFLERGRVDYEKICNEIDRQWKWKWRMLHNPQELLQEQDVQIPPQEGEDGWLRVFATNEKHPNKVVHEAVKWQQ